MTLLFAFTAIAFAVVIYLVLGLRAAAVRTEWEMGGFDGILTALDAATDDRPAGHGEVVALRRRPADAPLRLAA